MDIVRLAGSLLLLMICSASLGSVRVTAASRPAKTAATSGSQGPGAEPGAAQSLVAIAREIDSTAAKANPDFRAFDYVVTFSPDRLFPGATRAPADFSVVADFERPSDALYYRSGFWHKNVTHLEGPDEFRSGAPHGCYGNPPLDLWGGRFSPLPEALTDHPPVRGWSVDFPQVFAALKKNATLFSNGVTRIVVTTAHRLRLEDRAPMGCTIRTYNGSQKYRRLPGVGDGRAVMEIEEPPKTLKTPPVA